MDSLSGVVGCQVAVDETSLQPTVVVPMTMIVMTTVATQTENDDGDEFCYADLRLASEHETHNDPSMIELPLSELELASGLYCDYDYGRTVDFEYEEVTISRTGADQKVGLTLCYGSASDDFTDIFVGEVDPTGIAFRDGHIKEGDQILQINGHDVRTRQEAIQMFADSKSTITLLLTRPTIQMDDGFMEIYNSLDDLQHQLDGMGAQRSGTASQTGPFYQESNGKEFASTQPGVVVNDRSLSDNGINPRSEDSSTPVGNCCSQRCTEVVDVGNKSTVFVESEIDVLNREMQRIHLQYQEILNAHKTDRSSVASAGVEKSEMSALDALRSPRLVPRMGTRLDHHVRQLHVPCSSSSAEPTTTSRTSGATRLRVATTSPKRRSPIGRRGDRPSEPDTSAYNTGESCRSTPAAALESSRTAEDEEEEDVVVVATAFDDFVLLDADDDSQLVAIDDSRRDRRSTDSTEDAAARDSNNAGDNDDDVRSRAGSTSRTSQTTTRHRHSHVHRSLKSLYNQYVDVMYTNKANLEHTIMVQQNLFQQQLRCSQRNPVAVENGHSSSLLLSPSPSKHLKELASDRGGGGLVDGRCGGAEMEWVVKRRADGTRYVTRRPIRNRFLKERARKLAEERVGLTTDDDAASELKVGRYWTKDERRRQLEKARSHRRQKEMMLQQQQQQQHVVVDGFKEKQEEKKDGSAVEPAGHRKNARHKSSSSTTRKASDDFAAVQELLVRGSRESPGKPYNTVLSVTTV